MKGLKFLSNSWRKMHFFFWFGIGISIVFAVMPFVFHEVFGSEDYIFPKIFLFFPAVFMTEIGLTCGCRDIAANKLVRSMPIAKELYTRAVPAFVLIVTLGVSAVMMCAYFIYLAMIGAAAFEFADTLIVGAVINFFIIVTAAFITTVLGGGAIVNAVIAPFVVLTVAGSDNFARNGFGLPLWAAALIFAAAVGAAVVLLYAVSARRFRTMNVKTANPVIQYES